MKKEKVLVSSKSQEFDILVEPISHEELEAMYRENPEATISEVVKIDASDIVGVEYEEMLDFLSEQVIGNNCLNGVDYTIVAVNENEPNTLYVRIDGFIESMDYFE